VDNSNTTKSVMLVLSLLAVVVGIWMGLWLVGAATS